MSNDIIESRVAVIPASDADTLYAIALASVLRRRNFCVEMAFRGSVKKRMKRAVAEDCKLAIFVDGPERRLRDLLTGRQVEGSEQDILATVAFILDPSCTSGPPSLALDLLLPPASNEDAALTMAA